MRGFIRPRGATFTAYWSTVDAATGKRRQHSKGGFGTKGAAQKHLNATVGKVDEGAWRPDKPLTVRDLLEQHWLPAQRSRELRPATLAQYAGVIENWIVPRIGGLKVASLTPAVMVEFTSALRTETTAKGRRGLAARSAQLTVGVLKSACAWGVQAELLARNPIGSVRRPRTEAPVMKAWTVDESRRFLDATRDDRLAFAWAILLTRGLRRGELCGLRWPAVDLGASTLRVDETRITVEGCPVSSRTKTAASRRLVPLDEHLVRLLRAHRARQSAEKLAAGGAYEDGGYLVADELGRPYHPDSISGWFEARGKELCLPRIRLHDTRHTAASLMLASGVPVKVVSEMLGHASPSVTMAIYQHTLPGMAQEAGAALSASLLGGSAQ